MKKFFSLFSRHDEASANLDPERDWLVLLIISAVALIGIVMWNVWAFETVANGGIIGTAATSTTPVFSRSSLDAIRAIFQSRAAEEDKFVSGAYGFTDPSL